MLYTQCYNILDFFVTCIQIFRNQDEGLQWMVECTKLHPKMHVAHLGHLFYVLFVHHPDTAKEFFGSGIFSVLVEDVSNDQEI